jgi:ABC-type dipeptide/oligopeptide/nickel transport system permease component
VNGADYVVKRVAGAVLTLFVVITMNFFLFRVLPGSSITNLARDARLSAADQAALKREFGLDRSTGGQYVAYLEQLAHGNLGISYQSRSSVTHELWSEAKNTVPMVFLATIAAILLGLATGLVAAWRRGGFSDTASSALALAFYSMPVPWLGLMLLLILQPRLGLPAAGMSDPFALHTTLLSRWEDDLRHMVLPALTLALGLYGQFAVITRTSLLETLGEDYVLVARAKGLSNLRAIFRHALPNALLPIITLVALSLGFVVGGSILVETVFSWPGLGNEVVQAIAQRDYPMLQGCFLLLAVSVIGFNLLADLLNLRLDPRTTA